MANPKLKPVPAPAGAPAAAAAPAGGKKSKIIMIAGIVVLVGAAAGGGTWFGLRSQGHAAPAAEAKPVDKKPIFVTLEPFTVNLQLEAGEHYLQAGIVYQVEGDKVGDSMKTYMPLIRNRILFLLSSKKPSDLASAEGKQKLVSELVIAARESLPESAGGGAERGIHGAIFSSFVIQ